MSAQTSYETNLGSAYPGLIYAQAPHDIVSRRVEGVAGFGFGVAVSRGTDSNKQAVLGGTDFLGISVRALDREGAANTGDINYSEKETAALLRTGYIWAVCPAGCVAGAPVKYANADGIIDAGAAVAGETQLDGAKWEFAATAGALSVIRIESANTTAGA